MKGQISNFAEVAYIRRYTLTEGQEDGIRVCEVNNGKLRFLLNESKAFDMMQVWHQGENISFVSKNGFSKRETPFADRFEGGMIYTVGLDSAGVREGYEVHGGFHNIPAKVVSETCGEDLIRVVAEIDDTALFGKHLKMIRKVTTAPGSDTVTVEDRLLNLGTKDEPFCLLYHTNIGYPMLDEGARILYREANVIPRNEFSAGRIDEIHSFLAPVDNEPERCYFIEPEEPTVRVVNPKNGKTLRISYSGKTLPKMVLWQSNASGDYALGIEPTTTFLDDRFAYSRIKKGEEIRFSLRITVK